MVASSSTVCRCGHWALTHHALTGSCINEQSHPTALQRNRIQQHFSAIAFKNAAAQSHSTLTRRAHRGARHQHEEQVHFLFFLVLTILQGHKADENGMKNEAI
jgi:hypothetical protein